MIFHRVKSVKPLPDKILLVEFLKLIQTWPVFQMLDYVPGLFEQVQVDPGGYGIVWNEELDLDCNDLYFDGR